MSNRKPGRASSVPPLLVVLSGPSGVGKDATLAKMKAAGFLFHYIVTCTTRPKRPGELDGVDYNFLSQDEFRQRIAENHFLEWAKVYDNYYGVPLKEIQGALIRRQDVIVKVDVQGASSIKQILPDAIFVFLMPPSTEELANRLRERHGQLSASLNSRLAKAKEEMEGLSLFDYAIVSHKDGLDATVSQINSIIIAEKCRVKPRAVML